MERHRAGRSSALNIASGVARTIQIHATDLGVAREVLVQREDRNTMLSSDRADEEVDV
ncbi:MAG: hypothetical protein WBM96_13085 [Polyangiales bacterium]